MAAQTGIAGTRHNLGSGSTGGNSTNGTTEICVFCHTPHGANQSASAPLWNRVLTTATFQRYSSLNTTTFDAAEAPIGSVSIACLSCHDGTQAMDVVLNAPGSGGSFSSVGTGTHTGINNWTETNQFSSMTGQDNGNSGDLVYIGTDLRNDHPLSKQYGGGGISNTSLAATTTDPDYAQVGAGTGAPGTNTAIGGTGVVNTKTLGSGLRVWWVDTGGVGQQKTDFTLFSRTDGSSANGATNQPYVECATCHDPHSTNSTFLRLSGGNQGSQVCLTCHTK
jgi:predicted CXXCH cytochrome family protein